eukprot:Skav223305  [mRNA]  locus=scaffold4198:282671:287718:- [translate_table: standard]
MVDLPQATIPRLPGSAPRNYQTLVCELTGMEVANASLLDEGTAAAEAMAMIARAVIGDHTTTDFASMDKLCGALVQYPDTRGRFFKFEGIADALHKMLGGCSAPRPCPACPAPAALRNGAYFIVAADPLSLVLAKPPKDIGADVVVGSMQRFGVPMWSLVVSCGVRGWVPAPRYDRPLGLPQVRRMPGRLIGESLDRLGNPAYRLTLQTREQHIRLDKATSNVCTAQVLLANMAGMPLGYRHPQLPSAVPPGAPRYAVYHRKEGLQKIAQRVHGLAQLYASEAQKAGLNVTSTQAFFDTAPGTRRRCAVQSHGFRHGFLRSFSIRVGRLKWPFEVVV